MPMNMIQIGIIGVAGTLLAVQFKSGKSEYGIYISVALSLVIFFAIIGRLEVIIDALRTIANYINMDTAYIGTLIKMLGITYVAEFSAGICKDAGYQTIALQIEIFGKLAVLVLSMPVLMALLNTIKDFLS
ncbi:stage III sporulation protein AD [[Clostridium] scindens ATCC 35704]|nr:stage III sporulation protein AD [[Clostridium] scindens ATCC 35704]